jgi:hypothetical protein
VGRSTLVGLLFGALAWSGTASGVGSRPTLRLLDRQPVEVHGAGFYRRERVRVTLVAARPYVRTVRSSATGTFNAAFADVSFPFDRCGNGWTLVARGARGDAATLKLPQPECPPQLGP